MAKPVSWLPRLGAWLIDVIIIGVVAWIISWFFPFPMMNMMDWNRLSWMNMAGNGIISLIYWSILESNGQSIGKKALGLRLVKTNGKKASLTDAAISAFGKAFLLPLDWLIGVLARPGKKQ